MRHFLVILSLAAMASSVVIPPVTPDFSHYILRNNQNTALDVCAVETTPTGVQLSIEGLTGRTIRGACWQTYPAAEHIVDACGAVLVSECVPHTTGQPGENVCAANSPAGQLNNGNPPGFPAFTECVNIFLTHSGQGVVLNISGLELDKLGALGVFSTSGNVGQARFLADKACNTSLNNFPHVSGDVETSVISYPYPPYDTCPGCTADPCAPTPGGLSVGCCLTNSSVAGAFCPNASGCVEIPAEDCENLNGTVVADECPSTSNEFEEFACESRACCRGNMCESNVFVAKCLEDGGTPLDVVNCPVTVTGGMSGGMGSLNGNPCQLTGCCGGRGEDLGVEGNHANPPPAGMGDTRPACRSDLPAGSCRLLGGAPLNSNCSQGMNDERCACCLDVKKKCLQRMDNLGANQDGHGSGNFWADMFGNPQNDGNNLGSNTGSSGSNNYDWISMGSLNGGSLVTMDGARFDQFDDKKGTGSMMMNNVRFELREECETKCDECRNGTFVIILINHCNVDLEDVRVVDTAAGVTITKFVDVPRAKDGRNGIKALFIDRCVACGLENDVEVTSPLQVNAGMSTTIVGDAFCVLHDSAEFEVNNARNDDKPFQPFNPGSNDGHNNGQGPLLGPSPPWAQRPGTLFGRVP